MRVFLTLFRVNLLFELAYRSNFFVQALESLSHLAFSILGLALVYSHTAELNGWSVYELLALVGVFFAIGGLIGFIIQPSLQQFMQDIQKGTLDFALVKPVDAQLLVSMQSMRIWKLTDVLLGAGLIGFSMWKLQAAWNWLRVGQFALALLDGAVIVYSFWMILATLAFWLIRVDNLLVIFESLYEAGRWPVGIYPGWLRMALTFIVPVAFATTVPAQALTGRAQPEVLLGATAMAAALLVISRLIWRLGLRHYSGASA